MQFSALTHDQQPIDVHAHIDIPSGTRVGGLFMLLHVMSPSFGPQLKIAPLQTLWPLLHSSRHVPSPQFTVRPAQALF